MPHFILNTSYVPSKVNARRIANRGRIISAKDQAGAEDLAKKYVSYMRTFDRSVEFVSVVPCSAGR